MADYFYKDGKKYYKKQNQQKNNNCSIATHIISGAGINLNGNILLDVNIPPNSTITAFEDFTSNHNKALLQFFVTGGTPPITVSIFTRSSSTPITATLQALDTRIFQVEDIQRLQLTNASNTGGGIGMYIEKTFCICCNNQNNSCDEYYREADFFC
ncbi:exosporium protein D [Bacillus cytotoxicus]|uniref:Exosporium protein D n=1 Tax=Bacillus cytotoxicus TaxID=580165 RepID=A0AAX2CH50_9BACI|nr:MULTISPECIES: exosporium protein D [Bacillus cereus group]MDH2888340.1 exosporium protein D [Bacillus cytotoxicus]QTR72776.1 exosporium protein D [Bacillus cytotoxicus]QTR77942.1 exosporium protein D [Bacillus cytotoxicus]QTR82239.1 exosporium protein D [Bacillus cytotoxicus]QTR85977.1 exosporium protein D [Bacillus cytotoxicus]